MTRDDAICLLVFIAIVAILVTAPTWGEWVDSLGHADRWTVEAAQRHAAEYSRACDGR